MSIQLGPKQELKLVMFFSTTLCSAVLVFICDVMKTVLVLASEVMIFNPEKPASSVFYWAAVNFSFCEVLVDVSYKPPSCSVYSVWVFVAVVD